MRESWHFLNYILTLMYLSTHLFKQFFLTFHEHCEENRSMYNNLYY